MTIKEAKEMDMVGYLSDLGYEPHSKTGNQYWYLSPLRDEKTPSFKVNRKLNRWYDFGEGKGGNLVDFGVLYHQCSISDFLKKLDNPVVSAQAIKQTKLNQHPTGGDENEIKVLSVHEISSYPLFQYLRSRSIQENIARQHCKEVRYSISDKVYYALGFKNDAGGYELRNAHFKGSSSPKDSTFINNNAKSLTVVEGFFDFLSYQTIFKKIGAKASNYLVLNSASFFERKLPLMMEHEKVKLYLDNDATGTKWINYALKVNKNKFSDERSLYSQHNDLNDWLKFSGLSSRQNISLKL